MLDLDAIEFRVADCSTYNFGMRNADRLAHVDAPALLAEVRRLQAENAELRELAHVGGAFVEAFGGS